MEERKRRNVYDKDGGFDRGEMYKQTGQKRKEKEETEMKKRGKGGRKKKIMRESKCFFVFFLFF